MFKREATKHCCWGNCNSDSRYPDRLPEGTFFIRFPKPGKLRDNMTEWEKNQAKLKTEKGKRWQFLCGRKDFQKLEQIKRIHTSAPCILLKAKAQQIPKQSQFWQH